MPTTTTEQWREVSACRDVGPDNFFPTGPQPVVAMQTADAKALCRRCPVRERCLEFALETNQEDGIWGGSDEDERRGLRRAWLARRRGVRTPA